MGEEVDFLGRDDKPDATVMVTETAGSAKAKSPGSFGNPSIETSMSVIPSAISAVNPFSWNFKFRNFPFEKAITRVGRKK